MSGVDDRYSVIVDNTKESKLSSNSDISSVTVVQGDENLIKDNYINSGKDSYTHYPKIIYKIYERLGIKLVLSSRFSSYSYGTKEDALLAIQRIGDINVVYVLLEEVSLFGYSNT